MKMRNALKVTSRLFAVAGLALTVATSAQAVTSAPIHRPDDMMTRVRMGCGPGMVVVNGACVSRSGIRQARRCARWNGGVCAQWY